MYIYLLFFAVENGACWGTHCQKRDRAYKKANYRISHSDIAIALLCEQFDLLTLAWKVRRCDGEERTFARLSATTGRLNLIIIMHTKLKLFNMFQIIFLPVEVGGGTQILKLGPLFYVKLL